MDTSEVDYTLHLVDRCLDTWRSVSPNPQSFSRCDVCHFDYKFIQHQDKAVWENLKFFLVVVSISSGNSFSKARDLLGAMIAVDLVIMLLGYLVLLIDPEELIAKRHPRFSLVSKSIDAGKIKANRNPQFHGNLH